MVDRLHVGTRKGWFELVRRGGGWEVSDCRFLGDPVSAVLADGGGAVYAAPIAFAVNGKEYVAIAAGSAVYAFGLP